MLSFSVTPVATAYQSVQTGVDSRARAGYVQVSLKDEESGGTGRGWGEGGRVLGGGGGGLQAEVRPVDVPAGRCAPQHTP